MKNDGGLASAIRTPIKFPHGVVVAVAVDVAVADSGVTVEAAVGVAVGSGVAGGKERRELERIERLLAYGYYAAILGHVCRLTPESRR